MLIRWVKRYRLPLLVVASVILPLAVYRANAVDVAKANFIDNLVLAVTSPLRRFMSGTIGLASEVWSDYVDVLDARQENADLRRRLAQIEAERDRFSMLAVENEQLRLLLQIKDSNADVKMVAATVIGAGTSPLSRTLEINRGSLHGLRSGLPVVSGQGLVGVLLRVGWTSSEILILADPRMSVLGVVVRSRARGWVTGRGLWPGFTLSLAEVLRPDDAHPGDRVVTSGLGGVFPAGIPIGEISAVRVEEGVQHRIADLEPYVDFARLEQVLVLLEDPKPQVLATPEPLRPPTLRTSSVAASSGEDAEAGMVEEAGTVEEVGPARADAGR